MLNGEFESLKASYKLLEKSTCDLKLKLAATRSSLDDSEFAKKQLQKQIAGMTVKTPSLRSFSGFV